MKDSSLKKIKAKKAQNLARSSLPSITITGQSNLRSKPSKNTLETSNKKEKPLYVYNMNHKASFVSRTALVFVLYFGLAALMILYIVTH